MLAESRQQLGEARQDIVVHELPRGVDPPPVRGLECQHGSTLPPMLDRLPRDGVATRAGQNHHHSRSVIELRPDLIGHLVPRRRGGGDSQHPARQLNRRRHGRPHLEPGDDGWQDDVLQLGGELVSIALGIDSRRTPARCLCHHHPACQVCQASLPPIASASSLSTSCTVVTTRLRLWRDIGRRRIEAPALGQARGLILVLAVAVQALVSVPREVAPRDQRPQTSLSLRADPDREHPAAVLAALAAGV